MNKINVIVGTNNFGLGPVGKVSSIINASKDKFNWYACGNEFDLNIFKSGTFKDKLFSKDKEKIEDFVTKYDIKYAVVVLDVVLAKILLSLNVKVIFVDSLPFMWTQADIDEGLLPLDATVYCAQKCINLTDASKKVLKQITNLKWVNPIQNFSDGKYRPFKELYNVLNVGGLHSPIGNGESYIYTVIIPIVKYFMNHNEKLIITCGSNAKNSINNVLDKLEIKNNNLKVSTLKQQDFISTIINSNIFITSPGLTTIYETSSLNKPTIIIPPQNLSQFYNIEYAKKILNKYKTMNWETEKLNLTYLDKILDKGETFVVDKIYEYITELVNTKYDDEFYRRFENILKENYANKIKSNFNINGNGADDIKDELFNLIEEDKNV